MTNEIVLERRLPKQLDHLQAINDVRISAELSDGFDYFFACWESPLHDWKQKYSLIPDALFGLRDLAYAVEVDRGFESIRYFVRTKVRPYAAGFTGMRLSRIIVVAHTTARCRALARAISSRHSGFMFITLHAVRTHCMSDVLLSASATECASS